MQKGSYVCETGTEFHLCFNNHKKQQSQQQQFAEYFNQLFHSSDDIRCVLLVSSFKS